MQLLHPKHFVSRHEVAVASFDTKRQMTEVRRPAYEGLEAVSRQTEPGEKNGNEPQRSLPYPAKKRTGTSRPFSFDPNLEPSPQNLHRGEASGPPEPIERLGHLPGGGLRSSGMPHEGYADPVSERRTWIPLEHAR